MKEKISCIFKKIIVAGVIAVMTLTTFNEGGMALARQKNTMNYELLLNRIGVSAVYDESAFITRGDFTALAVQALGVVPIEGENLFADISGQQGQYINTAARMGLVQPNDQGMFYPDRIITVEEAAAICVRFLGYGDIITGDNAYPVGYMAQAGKLKLFDGVSAGKELTGADAAKVIFNTLDTNYLEPSFLSNSDKNTYTLSDTTYLAERFGVSKKSGTITSIYGTALNGFTTVDKREIAVDSHVYKNPYYAGFGYYTYLGRQVEFYTMDTENGKEVIYIMDRNEPTVVDFTDVIEVSGFDTLDSAADRKMPKLTYYNENEKSETVKMRADATILVNGEKRLAVTDENFDLPSGQITLVDSEDDGVFDVVAIEQHTYCRVSHFDADNGKIEVDEGYILFDIYDVDEEDMVFLSGDKQVGSEILVEGAVLQVMCSYTSDGAVDTDKSIAISITTQFVEGVIECVDEEGNLVINGKDYRVLPDIAAELKDRIGDKTVFYLGNEKLIVAYEAFKDNVALIYGYLVEVAETGSFGQEVSFLIYTENEEMEVFKPADTLKFTGQYDGKYVTGINLKKKNILSAITPRQLIRYQLDADGKIDFVELAYDHSIETDYKGFDENRFSLDYASRSAFLYQRYVGPNYKSHSHTVYFYVDSTSTNEDDFSCYHYIDLGHQVDGAKVKVYDSDTFLQPTIVVIEDYPQSSIREQDNTGSFTVVVNKRVGLNKDGDAVTKFDTYEGNTYVVKSDDIAPLNRAHYNIPTTVTNISQIQNGDIIKFGRRKDGEVDRFIMVSEYDETHTDSSWSANANDFEAQPHMAEIQYVKGKITSFVPNSHIMVECEGQQKFTFSRRSLTYIEYNVARDTVTYSSSLPRLTLGDYVWFQASSGGEISTLVRYIN